MIKQNINLQNVLSYFFLFTPFFLISGPFLTDLSISTLALSSFIILRNKKFLNNFFSIFIIIFCFIIILSSFLSENISSSLKSSLFYFRFATFSLVVWFLIETDKKILKKLYFFLIFAFVTIFFDAFFQYFTGSNILNFEIVEKNRISSFFGDELKMGSYLMRLFPLLVALFFFNFENKYRKLYLINCLFFLTFLIATVYLSGERTSFILLNFSFLLFLIFLNGFKKVKYFFTILVVLISFSLLNVETPFKKRLIDQTIDQILPKNKNKNFFIFSKQYNEHYASSWKMFNDNKILGVGPKNFRNECKKIEYNFSSQTCSTHPHNTPLQLLSETGIFSFIIYFFLNLFLWFMLIKNLFYKFVHKRLILDNFQISLIISIIISIFPFAPSGSFFNNWISAIYYFPVGLLMWSFRNESKMYVNTIKIRKKKIINCFTKLKKFV